MGRRHAREEASPGRSRPPVPGRRGWRAALLLAALCAQSNPLGGVGAAPASAAEDGCESLLSAFLRESARDPLAPAVAATGCALLAGAAEDARAQLARLLPAEVPNVIRSEERDIFYYRTDAEMAGAGICPAEPPYAWAQMARDAAVAALWGDPGAPAPSPAYTYVSLPIREGPSAMRDLLRPLTAAAAAAGETPRGGVWLSSAGLCAVAHFDSSPNVLLQVHGRKKVVLAPPAAWEALAFYPATHPLARQSRVSAAAFRGAAEASRGRGGAGPQLEDAPGGALPFPARVVELWPGDALYLPPFHVHFVLVAEGEGPAASANVYVDGRAKDAAAALVDAGAALVRAYRRRGHRLEDAVAGGLAELARAAGEDRAAAFLSRVWRSRYAAVAEQWRVRSAAAFAAPAAAPGGAHGAAARRFCGALAGGVREEGLEESYAAEEALGELEEQMGAPELVLADAMELLAARFLGAEQALAAFRACAEGCEGADGAPPGECRAGEAPGAPAAGS